RTGQAISKSLVFDDEMTIKFDVAEGTNSRQDLVLKNGRSDSDAFESSPTVNSGDARSKLSMNAVIPIRLPDRSAVGVLYADSIEPRLMKYPDLSQKLAGFGCQLGLIFSQHDQRLSHNKKYGSDNEVRHYNASVQLEPCSWLHLWAKGSLRSQREHV